MKLANLCCGSVRPQSEEWINIDNLLPVLGRHSQEWKNLQEEKNYREFDVTSGPIPIEDSSLDGVMCSHFIEHVDCQAGVRIMADCRRVLKPGGVLLVSVPDASYFRRVYEHDTVDNAVGLFGEPIHLPDGETTFFGYGLFNRWHKAILTEDALWCYFRRAGFNQLFTMEDLAPTGQSEWKFTVKPNFTGLTDAKSILMMIPQLNRLKFSLCMAGIKN